eukprot:532703_1
MSPTLASFSILSILLINPLHSQTGKGCAFTTCDQPGQVRLDAQFDMYGNYKSGCNCGCDPDLYDYSSSKYCGARKTIDFNPSTLLGDCSCNCPGGIRACNFPQQWDATQCDCACPIFMRNQNSCNAPKIWRQELCMCGCYIGSIGGPCVRNGQFVPNGEVQSDCTCAIQCPGVQLPDTITGECKCPSYMSPEQCIMPRIWREELCSCSCSTGSIGGPCIINNEMIYGSYVLADCTCDFSRVECPGTQVIDANTGICKCPNISFMTNVDQCMPPRIWKEELCICACHFGSIGGPCIVNGQFIRGSTVLNDCTCANGFI